MGAKVEMQDKVMNEKDKGLKLQAEAAELKANLKASQREADRSERKVRDLEEQAEALNT